MFDLEILKQAVMDSRDGITISDNLVAAKPLIFVNPAFERMTGYAMEEITGLNCRYLQNNDRDQPALPVLRAAIEAGEPCLVTLRNYRKDGTMFWNELSISPIFDSEGVVTNFIGIQKDVTTRVLIEQRLRDKTGDLEVSRAHFEQLSVKDGLTGIFNRRFFDVQFDIQWRIARRDKSPLGLLMIDIDHFNKFNDTYGQQAADDALKLVADSLNTSFLRASDFVARYDSEKFVVLSVGISQKQAAAFAKTLCERVRRLNVPHAASSTGYLTLSVGYAVTQFAFDTTPLALLEQADKALMAAKEHGRNQSSGIM